MRTAIVALLVAAAAPLAGCQYCVDGPTSHAVLDEPLGARCREGADCAMGLACLEQVCTVGCAADPAVCPAGSSCALTGICLPSCSTDADCLLGSTVGRCIGGDPPYCFPASCDTDAGCPPEGRCVDASEARGITWGSCATGFCQR